ncbi:hypothetical protein HDU96_006510 [Phlyctochytrium bullatum]|nr:hypothetical protein HDU96_006510 [Phlyctochytrium bullatum]
MTSEPPAPISTLVEAAQSSLRDGPRASPASDPANRSPTSEWNPPRTGTANPHPNDASDPSFQHHPHHPQQRLNNPSPYYSANGTGGPQQSAPDASPTAAAQMQSPSNMNQAPDAGTTTPPAFPSTASPSAQGEYPAAGGFKPLTFKGPNDMSGQPLSPRSPVAHTTTTSLPPPPKSALSLPPIQHLASQPPPPPHLFNPSLQGPPQQPDHTPSYAAPLPYPGHYTTGGTSSPAPPPASTAPPHTYTPPNATASNNPPPPSSSYVPTSSTLAPSSTLSPPSLPTPVFSTNARTLSGTPLLGPSVFPPDDPATGRRASVQLPLPALYSAAGAGLGHAPHPHMANGAYGPGGYSPGRAGSVSYDERRSSVADYAVGSKRDSSSVDQPWNPDSKRRASNGTPNTYGDPTQQPPYPTSSPTFPPPQQHGGPYHPQPNPAYATHPQTYSPQHHPHHPPPPHPYAGSSPASFPVTPAVSPLQSTASHAAPERRTSFAVTGAPADTSRHPTSHHPHPSPQYHQHPSPPQAGAVGGGAPAAATYHPTPADAYANGPPQYQSVAPPPQPPPSAASAQQQGYAAASTGLPSYIRATHSPAPVHAPPQPPPPQQPPPQQHADPTPAPLTNGVVAGTAGSRDEAAGPAGAGRTLGSRPSPLLRRASLQQAVKHEPPAAAAATGDVAGYGVGAAAATRKASGEGAAPSATKTGQRSPASGVAGASAASTSGGAAALLAAAVVEAGSAGTAAGGAAASAAAKQLAATVSPYSRSPEHRVSHKLAERKRRKEMKDLFDELKGALPDEAFRQSKASKWEILSKAIDYIEVLAVIAKERDELREENTELQRRLAAFEGQK